MGKSQTAAAAGSVNNARCSSVTVTMSKTTAPTYLRIEHVVVTQTRQRSICIENSIAVIGGTALQTRVKTREQGGKNCSKLPSNWLPAYVMYKGKFRF